MVDSECYDNISGLPGAIEGRITDVMDSTETYICGFKLVGGIISSQYLIFTSTNLIRIKSGLLDIQAQVTELSNIAILTACRGTTEFVELRVTTNHGTQEYQLFSFSETTVDYLSESLPGVIISTFDGPTETTQSETSPQFNVHLGEIAATEAKKARSEGNLSTAVEYYNITIQAYEKAQIQLSDAAERDHITEQLQQLTDTQSTIETLQQSRSEFRSQLYKAEQSFYSALRAQMQGQYTHSRTRYRQALTQYELLLSQIDTTEQDLFAYPISIEIDSEQPVADQYTDFLEQYRDSLALLTDDDPTDIDTETLIEQAETQSIIDDKTHSKLVALGCWPEQNHRVFSSAREIEQRFDHATAGYEAVQ